MNKLIFALVILFVGQYTAGLIVKAVESGIPHPAISIPATLILLLGFLLIKFAHKNLKP